MATLQEWCDINETRSYVHINGLKRIPKSNLDEKTLWGLESLTDYKVHEKAAGYILLEKRDPAILRTNFITKTAQECSDSGESHGYDGVRYYDPRTWELVAGDHVRDVQHKGVAIGCKLYAEGYRKGRLRRFLDNSSFPSSGDTRFDAEILESLQAESAGS